jgi:hypothetical protein
VQVFKGSFEEAQVQQAALRDGIEVKRGVSIFKKLPTSAVVGAWDRGYARLIRPACERKLAPPYVYHMVSVNNSPNTSQPIVKVCICLVEAPTNEELQEELQQLVAVTPGPIVIKSSINRELLHSRLQESDFPGGPFSLDAVLAMQDYLDSYGLPVVSSAFERFAMVVRMFGIGLLS